jgi:hypothetical protein
MPEVPLLYKSIVYALLRSNKNRRWKMHRHGAGRKNALRFNLMQRFLACISKSCEIAEEISAPARAYARHGL